ncbi:hypothetical protein OSTOST_22872, partial [Ostertagia ostertagi]
MIPSPSSKERKLLKPHNPGTSPVKICQPPPLDPLTTLSNLWLLGAFSPGYTNRKSTLVTAFIPIRKPNQEWTTRYNAIVCPEQESPASFKRPTANRTPTTTANNTNSEESRQDQMVVRALLRNELLQDRIDDIR